MLHSCMLVTSDTLSNKRLLQAVGEPFHKSLCSLAMRKGISRSQCSPRVCLRSNRVQVLTGAAGQQCLYIYVPCSSGDTLPIALVMQLLLHSSSKLWHKGSPSAMQITRVEIIQNNTITTPSQHHHNTKTTPKQHQNSTKTTPTRTG